MPSPPVSAFVISMLFLYAPTSAICNQALAQNEKSQKPSSKTVASRQDAPAKQPSPEEQLQQAINNSGNDRVALVRNLETFLKENPDSRQRPQVYRALVEACLKLRDNARAAAYAERIVALSPDDISMTILTIQLLERSGDEAALRRATNYATRVLEFVERGSTGEKSPKIHRKSGPSKRNAIACPCLLCAEDSS